MKQRNRRLVYFILVLRTVRIGFMRSKGSFHREVEGGIDVVSLG